MIPQSSEEDGVYSVSKSELRRSITVWSVLLIAVILLFEFTDIDMTVQKRYYNSESGQWMVDANDMRTKVVYYRWPKASVVVFGICCCALALSSPFRRCSTWHKRFVCLVSLSLIFVPLTVNLWKGCSHVHYPSQLKTFGGAFEYEHTIASAISGFGHKASRGFPGGHSTVGFALMVLAFTGKTYRTRILGFIFAVIMGWVLGSYQMLKGAHFLSHTIVSAIFSWILVQGIVYVTPTSIHRQ